MRFSDKIYSGKTPDGARISAVKLDIECQGLDGEEFEVMIGQTTYQFFTKAEALAFAESQAAPVAAPGLSTLIPWCCDKHFEKDIVGTYIPTTKEEFEEVLAATDSTWVPNTKTPFIIYQFFRPDSTWGVKNGVIEISPEIEKLVRSEYITRNPKEPAFLEQWVEGVEPELSPYLMLVHYTQAQLAKESISVDTPLGCVSIQSSVSLEPAPMAPSTLMRNALGIKFGGNGEPLDMEEYATAVEWYSRWVRVKK